MKPLSQIRGHRTKEELARIAAREASQKKAALGYPIRPQGMSLQARKLWAGYAKYLYAHRVLSNTDATLLTQLVAAKQVGDEAELLRINQVFKSRDKFPEPDADVVPETKDDEPLTLPDFTASVASERDTFPDRIVPGSTLCNDVAGAYAWDEGDAAAVARRWAADVIEGAVVAGELIRRAAHRFITDLENGHARGVFFDPLAARHIVQFAETFCGLKLLPWQVFCLVNIYSFKKPSGARRFTEAWISCSKKNGRQGSHQSLRCGG